MNDSSKHRGGNVRALRRAALPVLVAAFVVASGIGSPEPVRAQAVVCVNCSTVFTQVMEYAEALAQTLKQIEEYRLQVQQYEDQLKNVERLGGFNTDNALSSLRSIETIASQGQQIRYTLQDLEGQFRQLYPGVYDTFAEVRDSDATSWDALDAFYARERESYDGALAALNAAKLHSEELAADQGRMDRVESQLAASDGRLKAIQAAGQYAQINAAQLMKLRQVGLMQLQMVAAAQANESREQSRIRAQQQVWVEDEPSPPRRTPNTSESYRR